MSRLFEGPHVKNIHDLDTKDFISDGHCTVVSNKVTYAILYIDYFKSANKSKPNLITRLKNTAASNGYKFPEEFLEPGDVKKEETRNGRVYTTRIPGEGTKYDYFICKLDGTPYDSGQDYDNCYFSSLDDVKKILESKLNESLKEKIRIALKEDSVAKRNTRWSPDTQPNIYQLDIFLRKSGYRLVDVIDNEGHPEPIIESMKEGHLHPDITYSVADQTFYVGVKKYGELVSSDLEEVIEGYQTALGVVKHLDSLDLNKLEFREESEDEE